MPKCLEGLGDGGYCEVEDGDGWVVIEIEIERIVCLVTVWQQIREPSLSSCLARSCLPQKLEVKRQSAFLHNIILL